MATLSDLAMSYTTDPRELSTERSRETYRACLRDFTSFLASRSIDNSLRSFNPENIEAYVHQLFANGLKPTTVNLRLSALSGLANWLMRQHAPRGRGYLLDSNPIVRLKRPRNNRPRIRFLTIDELRSPLAVDCAAHERLALELIVDQPLRATEFCEAKVADLQLDGDRVALTVRVKGGAYRQKVLGDKVAAALQSTLKLREAAPDETLLVNAKGEPYTRQSLSEMLLRLAKRAGIRRIPVRAHVIRHSIASAAAQLGANVHELAEMLNHSDTNTVKRYVHGIKPDAALARVRDLLAPPAPPGWDSAPRSAHRREFRWALPFRPC